MGENEKVDMLTYAPDKSERVWGKDGFGRTPLTLILSEIFMEV
jgi:hypothetical protein